MIGQDVGHTMKMPETHVKKYAMRIIGIAVITLTVSISSAVYAQSAEDSTTQPAPQASLQARIAELVAKTRKNLVFVQGGSFEMGDFGVKYGDEKLPYSGNTDDDYLHKVTLSSFSIGAYKVTYAEYDVFSEATGRPRISTGVNDVPLREPAAPAGVSWQQAHDYCQWIGKQIGVPMSLPTEAQWEYAARDRGKLVIYATDSGKIEEGRNVASYDQMEAYASKRDSSAGTGPMLVGLYPSTPLGLYDMIANGREWMADWYAVDAYKHVTARDPKGPATGTERVMRGCYPGESLQIICMTFKRSHRSLKPPPPNVIFGKPVNYSNPNRGDAVRCVANSPDPVPKE